MTFFTGTQTELLYCMPVIPSSHSAFTTAVAINNTTYPCLLPAPLWQPSYSNGYSHALYLWASGGYETSATAPTFNFQICADTTPGTSANTLASTGAESSGFGASVTTGLWILECILTFTWATDITWTVVTTGTISWGVANAASSATAATWMVGSSSSAATTAVSLTTSVPYYLDLFVACNTSSATNAISCYQMLLFGCN